MISSSFLPAWAMPKGVRFRPQAESAAQPHSTPPVPCRLGRQILRPVGVNERRLLFLIDDFLVDHALLYALQARQIVHDVEHDFFEDRAQAAGARLAALGFGGDRD